MDVITVPDSEEVGIILTKGDLLYLASAANIPTDWSVKEYMHKHLGMDFKRPESSQARCEEIQNLLTEARFINGLF